MSILGDVSTTRARDRDDPDVGGFLQLCSDRRYHRKIMAAFESVTGLGPEDYYREARPGGAAPWADTTRMARLAYRGGASYMGWAGHGEVCHGFYGATNGDLRRKLGRTARRRADDFPRATHYLLFGENGDVEALPIA
jgi:hypothetical protein